MINRIMNYLINELKIIYIILIAEIYNSISVRNFVRNFSIEIYLDNQCYKIAKSIEKIVEVKYQSVKASRLILITRLQKGGGLTDIYNKISKGKNIFIIKSNIFNFRNISNDQIEYADLNQNNLIGFIPRIKKIVNYICDPSLKDIHILNDSCDPLLFIAYLISKKNPEYFNFYHHADHSFSFGASERNWNHIDLFPNQFHICKKRLNSVCMSMIDLL